MVKITVKIFILCMCALSTMSLLADSDSPRQGLDCRTSFCGAERIFGHSAKPFMGAAVDVLYINPIVDYQGVSVYAGIGARGGYLDGILTGSGEHIVIPIEGMTAFGFSFKRVLFFELHFNHGVEMEYVKGWTPLWSYASTYGIALGQKIWRDLNFVYASSYTHINTGGNSNGMTLGRANFSVGLDYAFRWE